MLKVIMTVLLVLAIVIIALLFMLGSHSRSGTPPGLVAGKLAACPKKPNCVCSEMKDDAAHFIEPIISSDISLVNSIIKDMGGVLVKEKDHYYSYLFTSKIFGFIDDFEVRYDPDKSIIHLRSASRVGRSDLGANRKRVENLRLLLEQENTL